MSPAPSNPDLYQHVRVVISMCHCNSVQKSPDSVGSTRSVFGLSVLLHRAALQHGIIILLVEHAYSSD
jgi:hypothetical protein